MNGEAYKAACAGSPTVLTSVEPFKLTTCTSSHKSNPLTVWWQKK